jgi:hypothetical protein
MSLKISRIAALVGTLVAVVAMSVAASSASALTIHTKFEKWTVTGGITDKKLNQAITLPAGSEFNGSAAVSLNTLSGEVDGVVTVPPFKTTLKILGQPAETGVTFTEVGEADGSVAPSSTPGLETLTVPASANIGFTSLKILGLSIPTECKTSSPVSFPLVDNLTLTELLNTGATFTGTTTLPSISCGGLLGFLESGLLTELISGPSNPYTLAFAPPA